MEEIERKIKNVKVHPKERASWLSSLCFCWPMPMFLQGCKRDLNEEDLYSPLKDHESKYLGDILQNIWIREQRVSQKYCLLKTIIKAFYGDVLYYSFFLLVQELIVKMATPLLIGKLMEYYTPHQTNITLNQAYFYASGIIVTTFCNVMLMHSCYFGLQHLSLKMEISLRSLIYRKALKLTKAAVAERSVGQIVNLLSNDVSKFDYICMQLYQLVVAPIQVTVVLYLLFISVDYTATVGVGLLLAFIPVLLYLGRLSSRFRARADTKTDNRINLTNEIISGIQVIKMYAWEKPFIKLVEIARKLEIREIKAISYVRGFYVGTHLYLVPMAIFLCILTHILTGNRLQAQYVYVVISYYDVLCPVLTYFLPACITDMAEIKVSLNRLQTFLLSEEVSYEMDTKLDSIGIKMEDVNVKWTESSSDYILSDINMNFETGLLTAVIGRVGCGKTTLIHTILKETVLSTGELSLKGKVSYSSQEPWLFSSSIRQNVLFGQNMEEEKYKKVIQICSLEKDFRELPHGDRTIIGEKGVMLSGGQKARVSLARAVYRDADIYLLDDPLSAVDVKVGKHIFDHCIRGHLKNKCVVLVTHQLQYLTNVDLIYLLEDGRIAASGTYTDLKNSQANLINLLTETEKEENVSNEGSQDIVTDIPEKKNLPEEIKEQRSVGKVSKKIYLSYFKSGGSSIVVFVVIAIFTVAQILNTGVDYFLTFWVNLEQKRLEESGLNITNYKDTFEMTFFTTDKLLYLYASLILFLAIMVLLRSTVFTKFTMKSSKKLYESMFEKIIHATMRFFNTNPSGRILNRFTRDIAITDEVVPTFVGECLQIFLNVLAITIVVSSVNPWVILPTILIFVLFYGYKNLYVATTRGLKRMEGTARSPIFSHLTASLQGLSTIRAFEAQAFLQLEFDQIQDHHSSIFYMFVSCSRTFGFWLDMNSTAYTGLIILSFLFIGTETYGGNVGLAITQLTSLTGMLQRGIRVWSSLETQMTSVERIVEYTEVTPEADKGKNTPPKLWPAEGNIKFCNVFVRYFEGGPQVLKNINLSIKSREKIGVVGRTGAGKSSLVSALFRLTPIEGKILIDDINIEDISLNDLRSVMSIIPQEPVMFSETLRKNLDPFDEYSDDDLWNALEDCELKDVISKLPLGLATKLSESGSNFSVGERQLLCLARAIIRKSNILIVDEATANVDLQTDELIQNTIRKKFRDCTVITIAHRLHTIMDSDKVLVLEDGRVVEFDHPHLLLENKEGLFYTLVQQTGTSTAKNLREIAHQTFHASS